MATNEPFDAFYLYPEGEEWGDEEIKKFVGREVHIELNGKVIGLARVMSVENFPYLKGFAMRLQSGR